MHQRSALLNTEKWKKCVKSGGSLDIMTTEKLLISTVYTTTPAAGIWFGTALSKKLILWMIVLLQLGVIGSYWLLQATNNVRISEEVLLDVAVINNLSSVNVEYVDLQTKRIKFIPKAVKRNFKQAAAAAFKINQLENLSVTKFEEDFFKILPKRLNATDAELEMANAFTKEQLAVYCYQEGTANETHADTQQEDWNPNWPDEDYQCDCLPEWHGRQCAQPELIYRTLMMNKKVVTLRDLNPAHITVNRLIYLLEGHFHSLDLLELQVALLKRVVDFFFIYHLNDKGILQLNKDLERRVRSSLHPHQNYYIQHCHKNCSSWKAFNALKSQLKPKSQDLFLYTQDRELISAKALKYLKYYAQDVRPLSFRLKFLSYGFYWQYSQQTVQSAYLASFHYWNSSQVSGGKSTRNTMGDLNHYGGWYCKYCQHPEEIIDDLHYATATQKIIGTNNKIAKIDENYIKYVIGNGLQLEDGKTQLVRLRAYSDKYFAPLYASENSWKFGHLLVNIYESLGEDNDEEELF